MKRLSSSDQIISEANNLQLYNKLVRQLRKDFELANVALVIEDDIAPEHLKHTLHKTLFHLIQKDFTAYLNVLYIVDVSEQQVKQLEGGDIMSLSESVSFLILKRAWQKVWYKENF